MKAIALNAPAEMWKRHGCAIRSAMTSPARKTSFLRRSTNTPCCRTRPTSRRPLLKEASLHGTPDDVVDQVAEWRDHGLRYPVIANISAMQPSLRRGLAATAPFMKILRRLRKL